jgi:BirA family biotin operon repressor/biotin-[acetyl-CoA-carboxylase] ligase
MSHDHRWSVEWHTSLPSTMDRATELAVAGAGAGIVVVADFQRAGRGTRGRVWLAPPGTCLMFTVLTRPVSSPVQVASVPVRIADAVADYLRDELRLAAEVKPPNDIVIGGRKISGVLCTSRVVRERVDWLLAGIGVNTSMREDELPLPSATSLAMEGARVPDHRDLLYALLERLDWLHSV